jgi:hypothetical protein
MPTTLIDSAIFGDIFSTDSMRRVWSDENRTQKYLDIESADDRPRARNPHVNMFQQKVTKGLWFNSLESHEMVAFLSSLRPSRSSVQKPLCVLLWPRTSNSEDAILNTML